ncbi:MAG: arsenical pump-driving ATPase [Cryobacterium sp.]
MTALNAAPAARLVTEQGATEGPLFLRAAPPFLFFTGKGGVGKTSLACAAAVRLAQAGAAVLLVSTDPASNVGQVFGLTVGGTITPIDAVPGLSALDIDPEQAVAQYRERIVAPVRGLLPPAELASIEEQLSGACTTEIASFNEFTELLTDPVWTERYDHIVFDTAPTGHTIRLLQLPGSWSDFLDAGTGDASCLGPLAGLDKQRSMYAGAVAALADPQRTRLVLVARAATSALQEAARTRDELADIGLHQAFLVVNGVFPARAAGDDPLAAAIVRREEQALAELPSALAALPRDTVSLKSRNLVGVPALRALFDDSETGEAVTDAAAPVAPPAGAPLATLVDQIAADGHGLIMLMGKGGVGKTTMAAAIAVALAERGLPVHLTTTDPAAHLTEALTGAGGGEDDTDSAAGLATLTVSRIDPAVEIERYTERVLLTQGATLDEQGKAMLREDLRSPCTAEIAVFQAFSRALRESRTSFVVMDTAPTGHTLLLIDATGSYDREIKRQLGPGRSARTPMMKLQDPAETKVILVTLPETTPVLEAVGLQHDLERAGITPWAWIVNGSLAASRASALLLRERAEHERAELDQVRQVHAARLAVVPLCADLPVGIRALSALVAGQPGGA